MTDDDVMSMVITTPENNKKKKKKKTVMMMMLHKRWSPIALVIHPSNWLLRYYIHSTTLAPNPVEVETIIMTLMMMMKKMIFYLIRNEAQQSTDQM